MEVRQNFNVNSGNKQDINFGAIRIKKGTVSRLQNLYKTVSRPPLEDLANHVNILNQVKVISDGDKGMLIAKMSGESGGDKILLTAKESKKLSVFESPPQNETSIKALAKIKRNIQVYILGLINNAKRISQNDVADTKEIIENLKAYRAKPLQAINDEITELENRRH